MKIILLYFLSAVLILTGSFLLPWVEKAEYDRGKRDGIAECEKNCATSTPTASLYLGPCSSEQEGNRSGGGGSDGSAFQYYCNGSKWVVGREFNTAATPKPGTITASPEPCTGYPWTYEPGYACLEGGITRTKDGYICHDVGGVPKCVNPHPISKPAPKPKPCDPCEGIKGLREEMDRRFNNLEESRLRTMISVNGKEWMTCSREAPQEFCERLVKDFDSFHAQTADPCFGVPNCFTATDSQYQCITCGITPVGNVFTFDGPCIDCPQEPHPNLPAPQITTPQSNGPGALLLYAPPPGLHVDSHTTATPEPRTLLLAAGGLTAIYVLRKSA